MTRHNLYMYVEADGSRPIVQFINDQDRKLKRKLYRQLGLLCIDFAAAMQYPHVRKLQKNKNMAGFYELRVRTHTTAHIVFFLTGKAEIILLAGYVRDHRHTAADALKTARARCLAFAAGTSMHTLLQRKEHMALLIKSSKS